MPDNNPLPTDELLVAMITSSLEDDEDLPDGPCVVLRGSIDAIRSAGKLFGDPVALIPAAELSALRTRDAELRAEVERLRAALEQIAHVPQLGQSLMSIVNGNIKTARAALSQPDSGEVGA